MKLALRHLPATAAIVVLLCALACDTSTKKLIASAEFGVFYGGQIQERDELAFEPDESRQQQGFRITFEAPLDQPKTIHWELTRAAKRNRGEPPGSRPDKRVTELGEATLQTGERTFERRFPFSPGDPLGLWNIRVTLDRDVLIDRPFTVYDKAARRRALKATRRPDAGF